MYQAAAAAAAVAPALAYCLFIYNLPPDADEGLLYRLFGPFGAISDVKIMREPSTNRCKVCFNIGCCCACGRACACVCLSLCLCVSRYFLACEGVRMVGGEKSDEKKEKEVNCSLLYGHDNKMKRTGKQNNTRWYVWHMILVEESLKPQQNEIHQHSKTKAMFKVQTNNKIELLSSV